MTKPDLFTYLVPPNYQLTSPDALLSEREFDLLRITVDDFRFVTRPIPEDLTKLAAEIRSRSTILRRLLCGSDLFSAGRLVAPKAELRVKARVLEFDPLHPAIIITCGNYPWVRDRLPGLTVEFSVKGVAPVQRPLWKREEMDVTLNQYLDGLAIGILGTPIRRREVVKYVADKKAAHVSEKRKHKPEQALDRAWSHLLYTIEADDGSGSVQLNAVYLEVLAVIQALTDSESIDAYITELDHWLSSARFRYPEDVRVQHITVPVEPIE
jgi:hypothetical protein